MRKINWNNVGTGWFGIPGARGRGSTKVHLVDKLTDKPVCGARLSPKQVYQWCASYVDVSMVECKACRELALAHEAEDKKLPSPLNEKKVPKKIKREPDPKTMRLDIVEVKRGDKLFLVGRWVPKTTPEDKPSKDAIPVFRVQLGVWLPCKSHKIPFKLTRLS
jgi:hypothetical protein